MKKPLRLLGSFGLALALSMGSANAASDYEALLYSSKSVIQDGMNVITYYGPAGRVLVYLPSEVMGKDQISGTVKLEPVGTGDTARRNAATLSKHALRIDGVTVSAGEGTFKWSVPNTASAGSFELLNVSSISVAETRILVCMIDTDVIPLAAGLRVPGGDREPRDRPMIIQPFAQRGGVLIIRGTFDGDFDSTEVLVDGTPAEKLAESPSMLIVRNPSPDLGRVEVQVLEQSRNVRTAFNNFDLKISAPQGSGHVGDRMPIVVSLAGLSNLDRTLPVMIHNLRPDVASIRESGGEASFLREILPSMIGPDGTYALRLQAKILRPGPISIQAQATAVAIAHTKGVTHAPHTAGVSFPPPHVKMNTWEMHVTGVSFSPGHKSGVTWPSHTAGATWPPSGHKQGTTWQPHTASVSFPPPHMGSTTWQPHTGGTTFSDPPHKAGISTEPHKKDVTQSWQPHTTGQTWTPHSTNYSFPPSGSHVGGTSWPPHTTGVSWP